MSKQIEDLTDAITTGLFQIPSHPISYVKVLAQVNICIWYQNLNHILGTKKGFQQVLDKYFCPVLILNKPYT